MPEARKARAALDYLHDRCILRGLTIESQRTASLTRCQRLHDRVEIVVADPERKAMKRTERSASGVAESVTALPNLRASTGPFGHILICASQLFANLDSKRGRSSKVSLALPLLSGGSRFWKHFLLKEYSWSSHLRHHWPGLRFGWF